MRSSICFGDCVGEYSMQRASGFKPKLKKERKISAAECFGGKTHDSSVIGVSFSGQLDVNMGWVGILLHKGRDTLPSIHWYRKLDWWSRESRGYGIHRILLNSWPQFLGYTSTGRKPVKG